MQTHPLLCEPYLYLKSLFSPVGTVSGRWAPSDWFPVVDAPPWWQPLDRNDSRCTPRRSYPGWADPASPDTRASKAMRGHESRSLNRTVEEPNARSWPSGHSQRPHRLESWMKHPWEQVDFFAKEMKSRKWRIYGVSRNEKYPAAGIWRGEIPVMWEDNYGFQAIENRPWKIVAYYKPQFSTVCSVMWSDVMWCDVM